MPSTRKLDGDNPKPFVNLHSHKFSLSNLKLYRNLSEKIVCNSTSPIQTDFLRQSVQMKEALPTVEDFPI